MTTLLPGRSRDSVVKGLAMLGSRLRHDPRAKCVDASPGEIRCAGRLLPNDGAQDTQHEGSRPSRDDASAEVAG